MSAKHSIKGLLLLQEEWVTKIKESHFLNPGISWKIP
jgi:hypothetical protein